MRRRAFLRRATAAGVGAALGLSSSVAGRRSADGSIVNLPEGPTVGLEKVGEGIPKPLEMAVADEPRERRFVVDGTGRIYVHDADGVRDEPFLDLTDRTVEVSGMGDERGLLGLAFHPDFADNGRLFVRYSAPPTESTPEEYSHTFVLSEFEATGDGEYADPDSERRVLEIDQPQVNHNAGPIAFGPDGYLYITVGDGGSWSDTGEGHVEDWYDENAGGNGQDVTENLLGSVLRIDVDRQEDARNYAIPDGNPLVGEEGLDEHYAWGFRNPWGLSFHGEGLYVADVGQDLVEEINLVEKGGNYGWNVREGTECFNADDPHDPFDDCPDETPDGDPLLDPIVELRHSQLEGSANGAAIVGGHVYDRETIPSLRDGYVFANFSVTYERPQGALLAAFPNDGGQRELRKLPIAGSEDGELGMFVLGMGQDRDGRLYVLAIDRSGGGIYRIVHPDEAETPTETTATPEQSDGTESKTETEASEFSPGFGVLSALTGLGAVAARRIARRDREE